MSQPSDTPTATLLRLVNGYQISQAIHVAAELKIEDRRFVASPLSELLRTDNPQSMWGWPMIIGRPYHWQMWGDLLHSVRTGEDAIHHRYGVDIWTWRAEKPEEATIFNVAMEEMSRNVAPAIIAACDFTRFRRIVDVGGANGALLTAILTASPHSTGVVFDLPHVVREASSVIRVAGLEERCEMVEGSYFEAVPAGGDAYVFKSVLMDHTDETCAAILRRVRTAMGPHGTLLVIEGVISGANEDQRTAFSDLMMLVGTGGRERREDEWKAVLAAGGFELRSITPTASRFQILEGRPSA